MACLDAAGQALHKPVYSLLGGKTRDRIETAAYLFYRYASEDKKLPPVATSADIVRHAETLIKKHGFRAIKLKGGVFPPEEEIKALEMLRARFPDAPLRWDPNAAWSVETSIRILRKLQRAGIDLEYLEDPTWNLEGCSQVRKSIDDIPLATNMCLVAFEQLAPGIRMRAVDIILSDVHFWGGFRMNQKMMAVCEAFQLGVGMHSDRELGVSTAAMLHLAAASPNMKYAIDSHYHDQTDDIITKPFVYRDGCFEVPNGHGLGVEVDWDKVARYHELYKKRGHVNEFYDPWRPNWVPALPIF
jgi:glucarate dehydratase